MKEIVVIGLGQFGLALTRQLRLLGQEVVVVDRDAEVVASIADDIPHAYQADTTDEAAVTSLRLHEADVVVVAMGLHSRESSILTTAILHQFGAPTIVARAADAMHARVLRAVGATRVVDPQREMGERLADSIANPRMLGALELGDDRIAEVKVPAHFEDRTLEDLALRNRFEVTVLAIRGRDGVTTNPGAAQVVRTDDVLVILGAPDKIRALSEAA